MWRDTWDKSALLNNKQLQFPVFGSFAHVYFMCQIWHSGIGHGHYIYLQFPSCQPIKSPERITLCVSENLPNILK